MKQLNLCLLGLFLSISSNAKEVKPKFPYLLKVGGIYQATVRGCRDQAHVDADAQSGIVVIALSSTASCGVSNDGYLEYTGSQFQSPTLVYKCKLKSGRTVCKMQNYDSGWDLQESNAMEVLPSGNFSVTFHLYGQSMIQPNNLRYWVNEEIQRKFNKK